MQTIVFDGVIVCEMKCQQMAAVSVSGMRGSGQMTALRIHVLPFPFAANPYTFTTNVPAAFWLRVYTRIGSLGRNPGQAPLEGLACLSSKK